MLLEAAARPADGLPIEPKCGPARQLAAGAS